MPLCILFLKILCSAQITWDRKASIVGTWEEVCKGKFPPLLSFGNGMPFKLKSSTVYCLRKLNANCTLKIDIFQTALCLNLCH